MEEAAFFSSQEIMLQFAISYEQQLLEQQSEAYQEILNAINSITIADEMQQTCVFLDCKVGRGKTFTFNVLINKFRGICNIVMVCGSTALNVTLYEGGRTAH